MNCLLFGEETNSRARSLRSMSEFRSPEMSLRRRANARPSERETSLSPAEEEQSTAIDKFRSTEEETRVWGLCLVLRAFNAVMVQTYFNPDEHWQSLEVAHHLSFGYGHLTWEWRKGIRSYLHPLIFAFLYKILAYFHLDTPFFMAKGPRLLQAIFASFGDLYLYKLSKLIFNENVARWALFCQLVNWFMFFCMTRTLSNSLETVLTVIGLFYWFSSIDSSKRNYKIIFASRKKALFIAALACSIRPTSAITWLYVGILDLIYMKSRFKFLFLEVIPIGSLVIGVTSVLDRWMYGSWVIVPFNFLKFNFLSAGGDYYGTHVFHWYFSQGFPSMLWTFLPFSIIGILNSKEWRLSGLILWVLALYSVLGHKEFRFVLPVLPISLMFSGYYLAQISKPDHSPDKKKNYVSKNSNRTKLKITVLLLLITNVPMALYMTLVHQRGTEDVMYHLSREAREARVKSVVFLMPCHSTPYYSTLHYNLPMQFLDCTPSENKGEIDESDRFMMNPADFVRNMFENISSLPSHLVLFDSQENQLTEFLSTHSFIQVKSFFHSHFKVDRDLQSSVVVYSLIE